MDLSEKKSILFNFIDEKALNNYICEIRNPFELKEALDFKSVSGLKTSLNYPLKNLLLNLQDQTNINELCQVIEQLMPFLVDRQYFYLLDAILNTLIDEEYDIKNKNQLFTLLVNCTVDLEDQVELNKKIKNNDKFLQFLQKLLLIKPDFYVIKKFIVLLDDDNLHLFCAFLWTFIKDEQKLTLLCYFLETLNKIGLIENDEYWELLQINVDTPLIHKQKLVLYLINQGINLLMEKHDTFTTNKQLISFNVNNASLVKTAWLNYCMLFEIAKEKQLHLVQPSVHLLKTIHVLHPSWLTMIYNNFLKHSQSQVVLDTIKLVLTQNWFLNKDCFFQDTIYNLLLAISKINVYDDILEVTKGLGEFILNLNENLSTKFIETFLTINFAPSVYWFLLKTIYLSNSNSIALFYVSLLQQITKLPHVFIRTGCALLTIQHLSEKHNLSQKTLIECLHLLKEGNFPITTINNSQILNSDMLKIDSFTNIKNCDIILSYLLTSNKNYNVDNLNLSNYLEDDTLPFELRDLFFMHICKSKSANSFNYLLLRLEIISENDNINFLLSAIDYYSEQDLSLLTLQENAKNILINIANYNVAQFSLCFRILKKTEDADLNEILAIWLNQFNTSKSKFNNYIYCDCCEIYFKELVKDYSDQNNLFDVINQFMNLQSMEVYNIIVVNLKMYFNLLDKISLKKCIDTIQGFITTSKRSAQLKQVISNYLCSIFEILAQKIDDNDVIEIFIDVIWNMLKLSKSYESCGNLLAMEIKHNFCKLTKNTQSKLVPILVDLLLYTNVVYKKSDRIEYDACRDIYFAKLIGVEDLDNVLNWTQDVKVCCFDVLIKLSFMENKEICGRLMECLLEKYQEHFQKRYFPDSQLHMQKLRSFQALLILSNNLSIEHKKTLLQFVLTSSFKESHQISVKQLLQLLLIKLSYDSEEFSQSIFNEAKQNLQNVSFLTTIIPVLYQISTNMNEDFCRNVTSLLMMLTMGALFALRLYAQMGFVKIYEKVSKKFSSYKNEYSSFYECTKNVLEEHSLQLQTTLNINQLFFNYFDLKSNYTLQTFLVDIPFLNNVNSAEWEIYKLYIENNNWDTYLFKIKSDSNSIKLLAKLFAKPKIIKEESSVETFSTSIQKKIIPWKENVESEVKNTSELIVVCSLIKSAANIGGLSRTSEIFKVKKLVISDKQVVQENDFKNLSMSSEGWVDMFEVKEQNLEEYIFSKKKDGYTVVGLEQTSDSVALDTFEFPKKMVVLLGNERQGIPSNLIPILDVCIEIPQLGMTRSLNVHVAGAIIIWEYSKKHMLS